MSFGIYIAGYIILIIGLAIGANMLNLPGSGLVWEFFAWSAWQLCMV